MRPCFRHRTALALLALKALDPVQEQPLRAHLKTCEGCRRYLADLSRLADTVFAGEVRSGIETSERFHRKVVGALRGAPPRSRWAAVLGALSATARNWRAAWLPLGATLVVVLAAWLLLAPRPPAVPPATGAVQASVELRKLQPLAPTLANYAGVAHRSLDRLDEWLTWQGNRNPAAAPAYTASELEKAE